MSNNLVTQVIIEVDSVDPSPEVQISQVLLEAELEETNPTIQICDLFVEVEIVPLIGFYIGEIEVGYPTTIEFSSGDSLREFDRIDNIRDITARDANYTMYKFTWKILDSSIADRFEVARSQSMPVIISDTTVGMISFDGFVSDYTTKTLQDVPPLYEISMTVESDKQ